MDDIANGQSRELRVTRKASDGVGLDFDRGQGSRCAVHRGAVTEARPRSRRRDW